MQKRIAENTVIKNECEGLAQRSTVLAAVRPYIHTEMIQFLRRPIQPSISLTPIRAHRPRTMGKARVPENTHKAASRITKTVPVITRVNIAKNLSMLEPVFEISDTAEATFSLGKFNYSPS